MQSILRNQHLFEMIKSGALQAENPSDFTASTFLAGIGGERKVRDAGGGVVLDDDGNVVKYDARQVGDWNTFEKLFNSIKRYTLMNKDKVLGWNPIPQYVDGQEKIAWKAAALAEIKTREINLNGANVDSLVTPVEMRNLYNGIDDPNDSFWVEFMDAGGLDETLEGSIQKMRAVWGYRGEIDPNAVESIGETIENSPSWLLPDHLKLFFAARVAAKMARVANSQEVVPRNKAILSLFYNNGVAIPAVGGKALEGDYSFMVKYLNKDDFMVGLAGIKSANASSISDKMFDEIVNALELGADNQEGGYRLQIYDVDSNEWVYQVINSNTSPITDDDGNIVHLRIDKSFASRPTNYADLDAQQQQNESIVRTRDGGILDIR